MTTNMLKLARSVVTATFILVPLLAHAAVYRLDATYNGSSKTLGTITVDDTVVATGRLDLQRKCSAANVCSVVSSGWDKVSFALLGHLQNAALGLGGAITDELHIRFNGSGDVTGGSLFIGGDFFGGDSALLRASAAIGSGATFSGVYIPNQPTNDQVVSVTFVRQGVTAPLLSADRDASANWRMAGLLSQGGIPNRTTVCATVSPRGSSLDDTANIQSAVGACPAGQVVSLAAGSFLVGEGSFVLLNKGITLRGAGAGTTILTRTGGAQAGSPNPGSSASPMIILGAQQFNNYSSGSSLLASDAVQGSYSVQVANPAGFAVGQIVMIDEASGAGWQPDRIWPGENIWASPDYRVVWGKHDPPASGDDFDASTFPYTGGSAGCWFDDCDRPTNEMHQVAAVSGNTITFDSPVTISYRTSHQATMYYWLPSQTVKNAGIESLTVEHGDSGNVQFYNCAYCWAKNVENRLWLGVGFSINASFRVQLEGIYIHDAAWPVPGGGGYAIDLEFWSSEALIEDSISRLANKVMVGRSAGTGSVVAYNYMDDGYIYGQEGWVEIGLNSSHMVGSHHVLFEGNLSFNADSDQTHGNSIYHTFFRNYLTGFRQPFTTLDGNHIDDTTGCCGPLRAAGAHAYAYWFSFVGNVLGTPGHTTGWVYDGIGGLNSFPPTAIWALGYHDMSPQGYDSHVAATTVRDGNFDYLTNTTNWTTSAHSLPSSLYLTTAPPFFSGLTWPWVVPDGTGQHVYSLPAKMRWDAGTPVR